MAKTEGKDKWILYKHTCNYEMVKAVALDVKNSCKTDISDEERHRMQERLAALNLYKTRNPEEKPLDSINHRINTLEFWMFGYEDKVNGKKKFIFSPLGNLFLKYISDESKLKKIFVGMMFAIQYPHSANSTSGEFQLFPFRLIFQLLLDSRLDGKLYNNEVEYLVVFQRSVTRQTYESLVEQILALRKLTPEEMKAKFLADEYSYVKSVYEWEYYTQAFLGQVGVLDRHAGQFLCKLYHQPKANSHSPQTGRSATLGYVTINPDVKTFVEKMLAKYSCFDKPVDLKDPERLYIDCVKEVYSFYPQLLLDEIGESDDLVKYLELPKRIEEYSNNPENDTAYLFEDVLTEGFKRSNGHNISNLRTKQPIQCKVKAIGDNIRWLLS